MQNASFELFGLTIYKYGAFITLGVLSALALAYFSEKQKKLKAGSSLAAIVIALPLGLIFSRLLYCFTDAAFIPFISLKNVVNLHIGGMSMFGAILGVLLATLIASKLIKAGTRSMLDAIVPPIMAFIFFERLGERFTTLGISRPLITGVLDNTFLVLKGEYDLYLKTWLLEAAAALILCIVLYNMLNKNKDDDVFLSWLLLFGASQAVFESLRFDSHMRFSFVGVQQLLSAVFFGLSIIAFALKKRPLNLKAKISLALLPISIIAVLGLEFLIDRSEISKWLLYAVYVAILAANCALSLNLKKEANNG
ncbi:MAG: prolipoprotein diacylglyceryl transferase [Eubacteriales bacterium]|nr:prolipoprotein diacylglyceryl transferase [Eubacteriales bacterium]